MPLYQQSQHLAKEAPELLAHVERAVRALREYHQWFNMRLGADGDTYYNSKSARFRWSLGTQLQTLLEPVVLEHGEQVSVAKDRKQALTLDIAGFRVRVTHSKTRLDRFGNEIPALGGEQQGLFPKPPKLVLLDGDDIRDTWRLLVKLRELKDPTIVPPMTATIASHWPANALPVPKLEADEGLAMPHYVREAVLYDARDPENLRLPLFCGRVYRKERPRMFGCLRSDGLPYAKSG